VKTVDAMLVIATDSMVYTWTRVIHAQTCMRV
jgi:hypothetical protein